MTDFRRVALFLTIGSFSVAALVGVLALLSGGEFGGGQVRVLLTTLCVGVTSVLALCYLAAVDSRYRLVAVLGGLAAVPTLVLALALTWTDAAQDSDLAWQACGIGSVLSISLAQATMLLVLAAVAGPYTRALLVGTLAAAALVAVNVSVLITSADVGDTSLRFLGVVAILDVLGTVAVTALARFGGAAVPPSRTLDLPADLARLVQAQAQRTGVLPEQLLRSALLAGLERQVVNTPTRVRGT